MQWVGPNHVDARKDVSRSVDIIRHEGDHFPNGVFFTGGILDSKGFSINHRVESSSQSRVFHGTHVPTEGVDNGSDVSKQEGSEGDDYSMPDWFLFVLHKLK